MTDFRSDRMPSHEGRGIARRSWDSYVRWTEKNVRPLTDPLVLPLARGYAAGKVSEMVGFWVMWHAYGGHQGLLDLGFPQTTIYRKVKSFRMIFGAHPDEFEFPGLTIDLRQWGAAGPTNS